MSAREEGIETNRENYTRFLHIGYGSTEPSGYDKTSLTFTVEDKPGTLIKALQALSSRSLDMTRIETRPRPGMPWEYIFFVDFEGHRDEAVAAEALRELTANACSLKVIGSYPGAQLGSTHMC